MQKIHAKQGFLNIIQPLARKVQMQSLQSKEQGGKFREESPSDK